MADEEADVAEKPKVLVLSGFLGSGKTTVLVRLIEHLRAERGDGYKIAIIENEIGSASVDSNVIQDAGYSVTELLSGCVCCTLIGQLVPALEKLSEELGPELIILEATGVASPESMRDNIARYGGNAVRVATLVDASRWERIKVALAMLLQSQLEPADVICINKTDLVDADEVERVEAGVRAMNATAPIVRVSAASPVAAADLELLAGE